MTSGQLLAILEPGSRRCGSRGSRGRRAKPAPAAPYAAAAAEARAAARREARLRRPRQHRRRRLAARAQRSIGVGRTRWAPPSASSSRSTISIPTSIAGSGREGRITKGDVLDYIADHQATTVGIEHDVLSNAGVRPRSRATPTPTATGVSRNEHRVAMTRLRARIAERLLQAQQQAAMLTTFNEVRHDGRHGAAAALPRAVHGEARHQARFHVVLRQSLRSKRCASIPVLNASVDGNDIVYHEFFDIGVAVSTDRGLVVPVLRNAEAHGLRAPSSRRFATSASARARARCRWTSSRAARSRSRTAASSAR